MRSRSWIRGWASRGQAVGRRRRRRVDRRAFRWAGRAAGSSARPASLPVSAQPRRRPAHAAGLPAGRARHAGALRRAAPGPPRAGAARPRATRPAADPAPGRRRAPAPTTLAALRGSSLRERGHRPAPRRQTSTTPCGRSPPPPARGRRPRRARARARRRHRGPRPARWRAAGLDPRRGRRGAATTARARALGRALRSADEALDARGGQLRAQRTRIAERDAAFAERDRAVGSPPRRGPRDLEALEQPRGRRRAGAPRSSSALSRRPGPSARLPGQERERRQPRAGSWRWAQRDRRADRGSSSRALVVPQDPATASSDGRRRGGRRRFRRRRRAGAHHQPARHVRVDGLAVVERARLVEADERPLRAQRARRPRGNVVADPRPRPSRAAAAWRRPQRIQARTSGAVRPPRRAEHRHLGDATATARCNSPTESALEARADPAVAVDDEGHGSLASLPRGDLRAHALGRPCCLSRSPGGRRPRPSGARLTTCSTMSTTGPQTRLLYSGVAQGDDDRALAEHVCGEVGLQQVLGARGGAVSSWAASPPTSVERPGCGRLIALVAGVGRAALSRSAVTSTPVAVGHRGARAPVRASRSATTACCRCA